MTKVLISCFLIFFTSSYIIAQGDVVIENFENSWEQDFSKAKAERLAKNPIAASMVVGKWRYTKPVLKANFASSTISANPHGRFIQF